MKRKRRQKSLAQKAGQRMKDLRERPADAKAEVSKLKVAKDLGSSWYPLGYKGLLYNMGV